jgi:hypothetical protein
MKSNCRKHVESIREAHVRGEAIPGESETHTHACADCAAVLAQERRLTSLLQGGRAGEPQPGVSPQLHAAIVRRTTRAIAESRGGRQTAGPSLRLLSVPGFLAIAATVAVLATIAVLLVPAASRKDTPGEHSELATEPEAPPRLVSPVLLAVESRLSLAYRDEMEKLERDIAATGRFVSAVMPVSPYGNGG